MSQKNSEVISATEHLIDAILSSNEYDKYHALLSKLARYPELKARIDEFRERNFELQTSNMDTYRLWEETDRFEREQEDFRSDPLVHDFLASELAFCRMMQEVFGDIMQAIEFD